MAPDRAVYDYRKAQSKIIIEDEEIGSDLEDLIREHLEGGSRFTQAKKEDWSKNEDQKLFEAAEIYVGNWRKIAEFVNSNKSPEQCFDRLHKYQKGTKVGKWTEEMDRKVE